MARRSGGDDDLNMDSLLDALTNVVGILILVLILTSIQMSETVRKIISEFPQITEEQLEDKIEEVDEAKIALKERRKVWNDMSAKPISVTDQLAALKLEIEVLKKENTDLVSLQEQLKALQEKIDELQVINDERTGRNTNSTKELQGLLAQLDSIPEIEPVPPEKVRLPEPSSAREGDQPRYVIVKNNKVYWIGDVYKHTFSIRDKLDAKWDLLAPVTPKMTHFTFGFRDSRKNGDNGNALEIKDRTDQPFRKFRYDFDNIKKFFDAQPNLAGPDLTYIPVNRGDRLSIEFQPREDGGIPVSALGRRGDRFLQEIQNMNRSRAYILFYVNPDSFEAYTLARILTDNLQIRANWTFWTKDKFVPSNLPYSIDEWEYDWRKHNDYFTEAKLEKVASRLKSIAAKNYTKAIAENSAIPAEPAALKKLTTNWENSFKWQERSVEQALSTGPNMRGRDWIKVDRHPPYIPHISLVTVSKMPTEVPVELTAEEKARRAAAAAARAAAAAAAKAKQMQLD